MRKISTFIHKNDMLIMTLIIIIAVVPSIFQTVLIPQDNLWNFGNIYKLYAGKKIYTEVNILTTPIFWLIGKAMLIIFGGHYSTFLLYGSIIMTILYILVYRVFRILNIKKTFSILLTTIIIMLSYGILPHGTNYNLLGLIFVLLGVLYSIKNAKEPKRYSFIIHAIIIMLVFLTMQKLGARICYKLHII